MQVNNWEIISWPVVSGVYKIGLFSGEYPEWDLGNCPGCGDCTAPKLCGWGPSYNKKVEEANIRVYNEAADFLAFSQLYYVSADNLDTLYAGETMQVDREYDIACKIHSSKRIEDVPEFLIGYLEPEGVATPTQKIFTRDPAGDYQIPCDQRYPYRIYGYRCFDSFMPYAMFPDIDPEMWSEITRYLDCRLYPEENKSSNGIGIRTTVMSYLQLDCTNDSTICLRPAAHETIGFVFRYGPEMGLNPGTDIRFKISDKDGTWVYEEPLTIPEFELPEGEYPTPGLPSPDSIIIVWNGRQNIGENGGHLADPHLSSYNAIVQVFDDYGNPIMETNVETFDVVPTIDSLLMAHYPWYPPPRLRDGIDVYTLIKARIDDSENPENNFRYYIPDGAYFPPLVSFWDGENFKYRDLPAEWGRVFYYRDFRDYYNYSIYLWKSSKWGDISYKWFWVDDYAESGGAGPTWWQRPGYKDYDMTSIWGNNWKLHLRADLQWAKPKLNVEMRILLRSQILNYRDTYLLQDYKSPGESESHAIITGPTSKELQNWNLKDWAITQMGTPYYTFGENPYPQMGKRPYVFNDCSGLVISARIQDIGVFQNAWYRLNHIGVAHMVQNYYPYPPRDGDHIPLGLTEITEAEADSNDIILLAKKLESFSHVVILDTVLVKINGIIFSANIIHAMGGEIKNLRQVRLDDFLRTYRRSRWNYKFMRFEEH